MVAASCLCGASAWEINADPAMKAACHCHSCQKTSGASSSLNIIVPQDAFKLTKGTPKKFTRKGDSGKDVTYTFCSDCPTIITVDAASMEGLLILKYGPFDDPAFINKVGGPGAEIYTQNRFAWEKPFEGAEQHEAGL